jgi:hypothetical protein
MQDFRGEQNATGTGTEGGRGGDEGAQRFEKAIALQELKEGGGFAAGDDQAVKTRELIGLANKHRLSADFLKSDGVGVVVALNGEDADAWLC